MKYISIILIFVILICIIYYRLQSSENFNNKYDLSVLAIFKNETMNLDIWIKHYIWQGVDHFYLIDNGSTDEPLRILQKYIDSGIVTLYNLPEKHNQLRHYKYVYNNEKLKENTNWLIMADIDEFWYCNTLNIKNQLKNYEKYHVIYSNWKMFGSSNLDKHPDDIRISIIHRESNLNSHTKWIIQTKYINSNQLRIHNIRIKQPENIINLSNIFQLNHYPIQSKEFYTKVKMIRGDVYDVKNDSIRDMKYFDDYNKNTTYEDTELKNLILKQ